MFAEWTEQRQNSVQEVADKQWAWNWKYTVYKKELRIFGQHILYGKYLK